MTMTIENLLLAIDRGECESAMTTGRVNSVYLMFLHIYQLCYILSIACLHTILVSSCVLEVGFLIFLILLIVNC